MSRFASNDEGHVKFTNIIWFHWWVEFYINFSIISIDRALKNLNKSGTGLEILTWFYNGYYEKNKKLFSIIWLGHPHK